MQAINVMIVLSFKLDSQLRHQCVELACGKDNFKPQFPIL